MSSSSAATQQQILFSQATAVLSHVVDASPPNVTSAAGHLLVLGILTAGDHAKGVRDVHRRTWLRGSPCVSPDSDHGSPMRMVVRFVLDERDRPSVAGELQRHGDLSFVPPLEPEGARSEDGGGLRLKPLAWIQYALVTWPASTLVGKMDADTIVFPCMLLHDLDAHFRDAQQQQQQQHGRQSPQPPQQQVGLLSDAEGGGAGGAFMGSAAAGGGVSLYYGTHILWHGCSRRGPPRMTCYAQGGLYVLSRHLASWVGGFGATRRRAPVDYAFEDVTLGSWVQHFADLQGDEEVVAYRGEGTHGDRNARLASLAAGHFTVGPFIHLNLQSGGNASHEVVEGEWCTGVYRQYGCCDRSASEGRRLRRYCAALESHQCRMAPRRPRPVPGCQGDSRAASHPTRATPATGAAAAAESAMAAARPAALQSTAGAAGTANTGPAGRPSHGHAGHAGQRGAGAGGSPPRHSKSNRQPGIVH
jgi:hypothetical protein